MEQNPLDRPTAQPKNWLVESILVTLFCCLPLGIAGIVNASKVDSRFAAGDYSGAEAASAEAKKWTRYGFISGLIVIGLYVIFVVVLGVGAVANSGSGY